VTISAALRGYAETPDRFSEIPAGGSVRRVADERHCRLEGPDWCSVSGVSVSPDELPALVADVRERVPAEKEPVWWIGPSARPPDLYERLLRDTSYPILRRLGFEDACTLRRLQEPAR
jgi:hypothetical protein